jgi:hypothetical protein
MEPSSTSWMGGHRIALGGLDHERLSPLTRSGPRLRDLHMGDVLEERRLERLGPYFVQENIMSPRRKSRYALLVLTVVAVALAPTGVFAGDSVRIDGTFTVSYMGPSAVNYCAPSGGDLAIEAQGIGRISGLGPMFLTVKKCFRSSDATYAGTFTMTAGNGDTLNGTYAGTQSAGDENGYGPFQGTLTITGGTGRFRHARGGLGFAAVATPASLGATPGTVNGMAFYLIRGTLRDQN